MKWKSLVAIVVLAIAFIAFSAPALAAGPTDCQLAVAAYTGLAPDQVSVAQQNFDTKVGFLWNITTDAQWQKTYVSRCNRFGNSVGLTANILYDDGVTNSGTLTFVGLILRDIGLSEYPSTVAVTSK